DARRPASGWPGDGRLRLSARSPAAGAPVVAHVRRRGDAGRQARIRLGSRRLAHERDDSRPHAHLVVLLVVERWTAAYLRRGLVDRDRKHGRGLQLVLGWPANIPPAPRDDLPDDG